MEKEISSGAMLGIVLIALAAIIGLGFGVFAIAKNTANDGLVQVQDNLAAAGSSVYNDYDQKVITGTQVTSAYKTFEGKSVAVLIATKAHLASQESGQHADHQNVTYVKTDQSTTDAAGVLVDEYTMINYNALLANAEGYSEGDASGDSGITLKNGTYLATQGFQTDANSNVLFDNVTTGMSKTGNTEYVPSTSRFNANLIKDNSGTILGVAFVQIG
jgi:hypothetical protein